MQKIKIIGISLLPVLVWSAFLFYFFGLLSNWFRAGSSIEYVAIAFVAFIFSVIILIFGIFFLNANNRDGKIHEMMLFGLLGVIIFSFFILVLMNGGLPSFYKDYYNYTETKNLILKNGQEINYFIEQKNSYTDNAQVFFVLVINGSKHLLQFNLPAGKDYWYTDVSNLNNFNWGELKETDDPNIFTFTTSVLENINTLSKTGKVVFLLDILKNTIEIDKNAE